MINKQKVTRETLATPKSQLLILQNAEPHTHERTSEILRMCFR